MRATAIARTEDLSRFWAAGRGSWSKSFGEPPRRFWPVHYAGDRPPLRVLRDSL